MHLQTRVLMRWERYTTVDLFFVGTSWYRYVPAGEWSLCLACHDRQAAKDEREIAHDRAETRKRRIWGVLELALVVAILTVPLVRDLQIMAGSPDHGGIMAGLIHGSGALPAWTSP